MSEGVDKHTPIEKELKELRFKLNALTNFVYQHHHKVEIDTSSDEDVEPYYQTLETSKPKVWVAYPTGWKEEGPKEEEERTKP